jgi:hypothetical protein
MLHVATKVVLLENQEGCFVRKSGLLKQDQYDFANSTEILLKFKAFY